MLKCVYSAALLIYVRLADDNELDNELVCRDIFLRHDLFQMARHFHNMTQSVQKAWTSAG